MKEIYHVVGIKYVNYTSKKTGQPVIGHELHLVAKFESKDTAGFIVDKVFCSDKYVETSHVHVGDDVTFMYNKFGNVQYIELAE